MPGGLYARLCHAFLDLICLSLQNNKTCSLNLNKFIEKPLIFKLPSFVLWHGRLECTLEVREEMLRTTCMDVILVTHIVTHTLTQTTWPRPRVATPFTTHHCLWLVDQRHSLSHVISLTMHFKAAPPTTNQRPSSTSRDRKYTDSRTSLWNSRLTSEDVYRKRINL